MNEVPFTQYLMPNGRPKPVSIAVTAPQATKAKQIIRKGYRFECELLSTGEVSLTIHDVEQEEDVAGEIVPNGPGVREAVEKLINEFEI